MEREIQYLRTRSSTSLTSTSLASTSLTPYGVSLWALILAACGGGGGGGGGGGPAVTPPVAGDTQYHHLRSWLKASGVDPLPATNTINRGERDIIVEWGDENTDPIRVGTELRVTITDAFLSKIKNYVMKTAAALGRTINEEDYLRIDWFHGGAGPSESAPNEYLGKGDSYTPMEVGSYYLKIIAVDDNDISMQLQGLPPSLILALEKRFFVRAASNQTDSQVETATKTIAISIHENRPANSAIIDLAGTGRFEMLTGETSPDHHHFRVDAATGEVFFRPGANIPLLDYERRGDADGDNIYRVQIRHMRDDGTQSDITLNITVQDLAHEKTDPSKFPDVGLPRVGYGPDEALIAGQPKFNELGLIEKQILSRADNGPFKMPESGPLVLTYSIVNLESLLPRDLLERSAAVYGPPDTSFDNVKLGNMKFGKAVSLFTDSRELKAARELVREALNEFEKAANLKFIEVADNQHVSGNLRFVFLHDKATDLLYEISPFAAGSFVIVGTEPWHENNYPGKKLLMHEIGHVLNLFHPFTSIGDKNYYSPDTVMSYANFPPDALLQQVDINALQFMYGPPAEDEVPAPQSDVV